MINTGGRERIVDLMDITHKHIQIDRPYRTTAVTEVTAVDGIIIAVAVAKVVVANDTTIAINQGIASVD